MTALEAKVLAKIASLEKEIYRQDEAIDRQADRSTHPAETQRLKERVIRNENQIEAGRSELSDLAYKVKVTWAIGGVMATLILAALIALIEKWIG
jgi:hypothetical protein